ncbi:MAG: hypothetical protein AAB537_00100 [Patescibacteria group bacterium]
MAKALNFIIFVFFSAFYLPLVVFVYLFQPLWEKWTESVFG